jgi:hypothetical protein
VPQEFGFDADSELADNAATASIPVRDKDGREILAVIAKYAYHVDAVGVVTPLEKPVDIDIGDTFNGDDPSKGSIQRPSQLFESKPGTDVILLGHAHPPRDRSATHVDVSLRVGNVAKTIRAHGLRVWQMGSFGGLKPGPARPIREPVPLIYELAWGGQDLSDEKKPVAEPRNYLGRGVAREPASLVDQPAAQLEDPAHPIDGRGSRPAAFNPIHRHWQPRIQFAGTYDEAWMQTRMPFLPADFDARYHVCVPPDQWSELPLRGGEPCEILGAIPEGIWRFELPREFPRFASYTASARTEHRTYLDTVLIDADARRIELTWRAAIPLPRKYEMLRRVLVYEKELV